MKKSMFRWFFVAIFCLTFSAGVQASFLDDLKAGKITIEEVVKKLKKDFPGLPIGGLLSLMIDFSPKKAGKKINFTTILKAVSKGASTSEAKKILSLVTNIILSTQVGTTIDDETKKLLKEIGEAISDESSVDLSEEINAIDKTNDIKKIKGIVKEEVPASPN